MGERAEGGSRDAWVITLEAECPAMFQRTFLVFIRRLVMDEGGGSRSIWKGRRRSQEAPRYPCSLNGRRDT